jgi:hypothetical protein
MSLELNKISDIVGGVSTEAIVEGRMVLRVAQSEDYNFGGRDDLNGFKVPATAAEAAKARFVAKFAQSNQKQMPYYEALPNAVEDNGYQLRQGYGVGTNNVPFTVKTYLTYPGLMKGQTIPSGVLMVGHAGGVYTVASGDYVANANIAVDGYLDVANTADDGAGEGGKLIYSASATNILVDHYDNANGILRFRTFQP